MQALVELGPCHSSKNLCSCVLFVFVLFVVCCLLCVCLMCLCLFACFGCETYNRKRLSTLSSHPTRSIAAHNINKHNKHDQHKRNNAKTTQKQTNKHRQAHLSVAQPSCQHCERMVSNFQLCVLCVSCATTNTEQNRTNRQKTKHTELCARRLASVFCPACVSVHCVVCVVGCCEFK